MYSIGHGKCGKSILNCLHVCPAKFANARLKDGTYAVQGDIVAIEETKWGSVIMFSLVRIVFSAIAQMVCQVV